MLLNKRFATTSLASLVILSGAGYSLVLAEEAEKPFEISTNQRDQTEDKGHSDFDSQVWNQIADQTFTMWEMSADGNLEKKDVKFRDVKYQYLYSRPGSEGKTEFQVNIIPQLNEWNTLYFYNLRQSSGVTITGKLGEENAEWIVTQDPDFLIVEGKIPDKISFTVNFISRDNNKAYQLAFADYPISKLYLAGNIYDLEFNEQNEPVKVKGIEYNGEIPVQTLQNTLEKQVGKKVIFKSINPDLNLAAKQDTGIETEAAAAESVSSMVSRGVIMGKFYGQPGSTFSYGGHTYNEDTLLGIRPWIIYFSEQSPSSQPGSRPSSTPSKPTTKPVQKPAASSTPKESYRLYNPLTGEHFFTTNKAEYDSLCAGGIWKAETSTWKTPEKSDFPIYRVCNPNTGDHHYTMDAHEKDVLVSLGWKDEGIGMYSADKDGEAVYRLYNPNAKVGSHHYTNSAAERDSLTALGWKDEGIGFYGLK